MLDQARLLASLHRFDEADAACIQAIRLAPTAWFVYQTQGEILTQQKRQEEALQAYQKVVQLVPNASPVYLQLGDTQSALERFAQAARAYDQALQLQPNDLSASYAKAQALERLGQDKQALAAYEQGLQHSPRQFALLFGRAEILKKLMRYEEANAQYQKAEHFAPHCIAAATCIGFSVDLGKIAAAKGRLQARGSALSHELISAELTWMFQEKQINALRASHSFSQSASLCRSNERGMERQNSSKRSSVLAFLRYSRPGIDQRLGFYKKPGRFCQPFRKKG